MKFNEFLNTDIDNCDEIIEYYINYLTEFSSKEFPYEQGLQLKGSAEKFTNAIDKASFLGKEKVEVYIENIENFSRSLRYYRKGKDYSKFMKLFFPVHKTSITRFNEFEKIYSNSLNLVNEYNKIAEYRMNNISMNGFYDTKITNKDKIKELIEEAINLINQESSITVESKKQLVKYLNKVIENLDKENTDWTKVIGRIKEIAIILGALSTVIGNSSSLFFAKEKLEETSKVVEKTSINLNHTTINQTFIMQDIKQLNSFNTILIKNKDKN